MAAPEMGGVIMAHEIDKNTEKVTTIISDEEIISFMDEHKIDKCYEVDGKLFITVKQLFLRTKSKTFVCLYRNKKSSTLN